MSTDELHLLIENVGGFAGQSKFTLKPGLNVVQAPNAVGKTSFIRALQLLVLGERELRGMHHFMNLFATGEAAKARVSIEGAIKIDRKFRRAGEDLVPMDPPLTTTDGGRIISVCFATQENRLISTFLGDESVRGLVESFAGVDRFDAATELLDDLLKQKRDLHTNYRQAISTLEEFVERKASVEKEITKLRERLEEMPDYDDGLDKKQREQKTKIDEMLREVNRKIADTTNGLASAEGELRHVNAQIERLTRRLENLGKDTTRIDQEAKAVFQESQKAANESEERKKALYEVERRLQSLNQNFESWKQFDFDMSGRSTQKCFACNQPVSYKQLQNYAEQLEEAKLDWQRKVREADNSHKRLKAEYQQKIEEKEQAERAMGELDDSERQKANLEKGVVRSNRELDALAVDREHNEKQYASIIIDPSLRAKIERRQKQVSQLQGLEATREYVSKEIDGLTRKTAGAEKLGDEIKFVSAAIQHMKIRRREIVDAVRIRFNERAGEMMSRLGFKDFEDVEITEDYRIYIRRPRQNPRVPKWPLEALSASERYTIAISFLLAAKREFVPNFPFFVLDEIVTSYDPARFERIKQYLAGASDYVIITKLASSGKDHVEIVR